ncbi:MAG: TonB-dependent receptor [Dysgonamonadaceae bacterium]|jgi:TonB-linked SusC/RagA family outer membrane protein|nr:TonB-dependent receptor [Dysgonamonadaceae bacterium]
MKRLIILFISLLVVTVASAQQFQLTGKVTAIGGEELIGASIFIAGTSAGTFTDLDGNYSLTVKPGDKVTASYLGFQTTTITVGNQKVLDIQLMPDQSSLDEVVVVGYGKAKRITMTGSVSAITAREIRNIPTSSVQNALTGKLPGFFSQQRSGQPGKDASDFFIRGVSSLNTDGNQPLIVVDDIQYSYDQLQQININEIESISILKDASTTAIYGIKGANGVLVVKTRRGVEGSPQVNVRLETGIQMPVRTPKFLNSYETVTLVNEAYRNDGLETQQPFSAEDLLLFQTGEDPYGHPDVNWYDEIFDPIAYQQNANLDISGGSQRLKYFITGGMFSQNGLVKDFSDPFNEVNTNYYYNRFNYRSNLDFDVTEKTNLRLDITSRFMNINEPRSMNATGEIYDFSKMHPYSAPVKNPDGSYAYIYDTDGKQPTLNARLANEGYKRTRRFDSNFLFEANQDFDFIVKGLTAKLRVAYSSIDENYRQAVRGEYPTYHYDSATDSYTIHPSKNYAYGTYMINGDQEKSIKDLNLQGFLNYETTFRKDHNLKLMLIYNRQSKTVDKDGITSAAVPANFEGYSTAVSYNFQNKYLFDLNMAYNGTDRFGKDNRFGFFPSLAAGYSISEEDFFRDRFSDFQLLKLRASYGLVGSDVAPGNRYLYKHVYKQGDGYPFGPSGGEGGGIQPSYKEDALGNDYVTWEKAKKFDVGIDANFFDKWSLTLDYFRDYRFDQLVERQDVSKILGVNVSPTNVAETVNRGMDGQIGFQTKIGQVFFNTNFVFSYAKNKVLFKAEAQQRYPWLAETGHAIGQPFGYHFIGFYSQEDIDIIVAGNKTADGKIAVAIPNTDVPVQAGDLKYQDLNGDGVIDDFDKKAIGRPNLPSTTLGWTFGAQYKGFSISVLLQGSFDYSFSVIGTGIESFKSQFQPVHLTRWTQERANAGEPINFPRLTRNPATVNSAEAYMSDFWLINAWYMRLKTVDLAYQIPSKILPSKIGSARLYLNAYNLFTLTNYDKYQQDPEIKTNSAGDAYMNQRVINLGLQLSF